MAVDKLGIKKLYQTSGREWFSKWDNGQSRRWTDQSNDPYDPEFITAHKGTGSWSTDGKGVLKISGSGPRMYVMDASQTKYWHSVEITVYAMRVADSNIGYGGIMAYARTNHFIDANSCDTRGYGGRFTYDGRIDYEKEINHHASSGGYAQVATKKFWSGGLPRNVWIGYKFVVYDLTDGNVKLELYMDTTDGIGGGDWKKVDEFIDNGKNFGVGGSACKSGISPALKLTVSDSRPGSESGKPNLSVYFRSDGVGINGLWYKKASIREITISNKRVSPCPPLGDVDNDGEILATDALLALKIAVGEAGFTEEQIKRADVNGDGIVTASDALLILRYAVGEINNFPGC